MAIPNRERLAPGWEQGRYGCAVVRSDREEEFPSWGKQSSGWEKWSFAEEN
jgi:hypothetical protein